MGESITNENPTRKMILRIQQDRDLCVTLAGLAVVWLLLHRYKSILCCFDVQIGDIIVFDRPSDHDRVIVHRVESITNENPIELRTKG